MEQKIVKKAISIKKKQILKEAALDEISDDETPMEAIKQIVKKKKQPVTQLKKNPNTFLYKLFYYLIIRQ